MLGSRFSRCLLNDPTFRINPERLPLQVPFLNGLVQRFLKALTLVGVRRMIDEEERIALVITEAAEDDILYRMEEHLDILWRYVLPDEEGREFLKESGTDLFSSLMSAAGTYAPRWYSIHHACAPCGC